MTLQAVSMFALWLALGVAHMTVIVLASANPTPFLAVNGFFVGIAIWRCSVWWTR